MNEHEMDSDVQRRIRDGGVTVLVTYLNAHRPQLLAFIRRRSDNALKAKVVTEDILQETTVEAVRALTPDWPGDRDVFSWLCQVAERRVFGRTEWTAGQRSNSTTHRSQLRK